MAAISYGSHGGSLFCAGIEFDLQDRSSSPTETESLAYFTGILWNELNSSGNELKTCRLELDSCGKKWVSVASVISMQGDSWNILSQTKEWWAVLINNCPWSFSITNGVRACKNRPEVLYKQWVKPWPDQEKIYCTTRNCTIGLILSAY